MVYKFKLVSDEVSNFSREIEIDANSSFLQLRNAILDSVDYSKDDIDSFFLCDDEWQREEHTPPTSCPIRVWASSWVSILALV